MQLGVSEKERLSQKSKTNNVTHRLPHSPPPAEHRHRSADDRARRPRPARAELRR